MRRVFLFLFALMIITATAFAGGARQRGTTSFRFGHDMPEDHPYHVFATVFANEVYARTNGEVEIIIFPGAVLGSEVAMTDGLRMGTLDFLISTTGNSSALLPQLGVMGMPMMYESPEHVLAVARDRQLFEFYRDIVRNANVGVELIGFAGSAPRHIYANRNIRSIDDVRGLTIRTQPAPIEVEIWRAFGAIPVTMPFAEIYTALSTGLVNAAENNPTSFFLNNHHEVAPYFIRTEHSWMMHPILASSIALNRVDAELRSVFYAAAEIAAQAIFEAHLVMDVENLRRAIAAGVTYTPEFDREPFMRIAAPIQERFARDLGTEWALNRIRSLAR